MNTKSWSIAVLAVALASPSMAFTTGETPVAFEAAGKVPSTIAVAAIDRATDWINSKPQSVAALRGKVVLINFWTYSCINWRRQLPYVRAWAEKYKGLSVIGVHTPEFEFEKEVHGVQMATSEMGVPYAVVLDNDYRIWNGFGNNSWPAIYLMDAAGRIRYRHFGEGRYEASERAIQMLLAEAGLQGEGQGLVNVKGLGLEAPPDVPNLRTPEVYVGRARASGEAMLSTGWKLERERAVSTKPNARIGIKFHARDLHLVMGPAGRPVRFRILLDGKPPGVDHGGDVDENGYGTATTRTLYQLVRQKGAIAGRKFEIEFFDTGSEVYSFTFG